jgi:hypothetical protein
MGATVRLVLRTMSRLLASRHLGHSVHTCTLAGVKRVRATSGWKRITAGVAGARSQLVPVDIHLADGADDAEPQDPVTSYCGIATSVIDVDWHSGTGKCERCMAGARSRDTGK